MPITFENENKIYDTSTLDSMNFTDDNIHAYNDYIMEKFRLIPIDQEKLKNLVTTNTRYAHIQDKRVPPIRHSWVTSIGTNYVISLFPKKNNYVAVVTKETFLRPVKRTQKGRRARARLKEFKKKNPNFEFFNYDLQRSKSAWQSAGRLAERSLHFPATAALLKRRTIAEIKEALGKNKKDRTLSEVLRAAGTRNRRLEEEKKRLALEKEKKKPRTLNIRGEDITLGSFFPDDYDEKFRKKLRLTKLSKMLKRHKTRLLARRYTPKNENLLAQVARNLQHQLFATTLPTVRRPSYKRNLYNFKRFIRGLRYPKTQVLAWSTAGKMGFEGPKRPTPYAAQVLGKYIGAQVALKEIRYINLRLHTRVNKHVRSFIRGLHMTKEDQFPVRIHKIIVPHVFAHGSIRKRKQRRV